MPTSIFQPGDEVLLRENGTQIKGVVKVVQGSQITLLTEDGRTLARDSCLITHLCPTAPKRRALPLPPVHERLKLLSQAVDAADPLLDLHRVPRQVSIDQHTARLKVQALARGVGADENVNLSLA